MSKRSQRIGVLLGIAGFFVFIVWLFLQAVPYIGLKLISPARERQLGQQMFYALTANENKNAEATDLAQAFANKLSLSPVYPIKITVINSKVENAYALPGGNIVIYSAMLNAIDEPQEFAALLGHEASHINHRHSLRSMLKDLASGMLLSFVIGDANGVAGVLLQNADMLRSLSYSRKLETEADTEGMNLLLKNRIDVSGMRLLLQTLEEDMPEGSRQISFLSTHPLTKERISQAENFIREHDNKTAVIDSSLQAIWLQLKGKK